MSTHFIADGARYSKNGNKSVMLHVKKDGIACPSSLHKGLFLNAATDDIDPDPSSTGEKSTFHGASIYFFQHPKSKVTGPNDFKLENDAYNLPKLALPKSCTDMMLLIGGQLKYPVSNLPRQTPRIITLIEAQARGWISGSIDIEEVANLPITGKALFSAFLAEMYRTSRPCRDLSALMPFQEIHLLWSLTVSK